MAPRVTTRSDQSGGAGQRPEGECRGPLRVTPNCRASLGEGRIRARMPPPVFRESAKPVCRALVSLGADCLPTSTGASRRRFHGPAANRQFRPQTLVGIGRGSEGRIRQAFLGKLMWRFFLAKRGGLNSVGLRSSWRRAETAIVRPAREDGSHFLRNRPSEFRTISLRPLKDEIMSAVYRRFVNTETSMDEYPIFLHLTFG